MRFAHILVEGQTEESFVRQVLGPHLLGFGLHLNPVLVSTKRSFDGTKFKGGVNSYSRLRQDVRLLLHDTSAVVVTTMLDLYGVPADFVKREAMPCASRPGHKASYLEQAFAADINHSRFLPYLSLHEFESLVLVEPAELTRAVGSPGKSLPPALSLGGLPPEEINDGPTTHPAARIAAAFPAYKKPLHGPLVTGRVGIPRLRSACPHFGAWVSRLEALGAP